MTTSRTVTPKISIPKTSTKNQPEALSEEGTKEPNCGCSEMCANLKVDLVDAIKMSSRNKMKAARRMKAFEDAEKHATEALQKEDKKPTVAWPGLKVFAEKRPHSLRPLAGGGESDWEYLEAIVDSGATVTVIPPHVGKEYEVVPGEASKAGVKYEVANGDEIPNLGEKLLPVVTAEGSWRGMLAQVADVSKALQSVRALVRSGHVVVFGDGDSGSEHYVYNKLTGDTNLVKDDGVNYLMGLHIAPRTEAGFGRPVTAP